MIMNHLICTKPGDEHALGQDTRHLALRMNNLVFHDDFSSKQSYINFGRIECLNYESRSDDRLCSIERNHWVDDGYSGQVDSSHALECSPDGIIIKDGGWGI